MFGVESLARIVRHDALKVVKVPAKGTREAYEYWRNFGLQATKDHAVMMKEYGLSNSFEGFSPPKNVFAPLSNKDRVKTGSMSFGLFGFGNTKGNTIGQSYAYKLTYSGLIKSSITQQQKGFILEDAKAIEDEVGLSEAESIEAAHALSVYSFGSGNVRRADLAGQEIYAPNLLRNQPPVPTVKAIYKLLDKAKPYSKDDYPRHDKYGGAIYRGMILPSQEALDRFVEGAKKGMTMNCLSSFSADPSVSLEFSRKKTRKGGDWGDDISESERSVMLVASKNKSGVYVSRYMAGVPISEHEVLVKKGAKYRLTGIESGIYDDAEFDRKTGLSPKANLNAKDKREQFQRTYLYIEEVEDEKRR